MNKQITDKDIFEVGVFTFWTAIMLMIIFPPYGENAIRNLAISGISAWIIPAIVAFWYGKKKL
jgi:hypothetical protein